MQYCFEQILQEFNTMFQTQAPQNIRHKRLKKCSKNGAESHAKTGRLKQSKISKLKHYPGASWLTARMATFWMGDCFCRLKGGDFFYLFEKV